jgi:DNA-binding GntR family transcriptional regulator
LTDTLIPRRSQDRQTLVPGIALVLREQIWKGELLPGEHLKQQQLADSLKVSLIPLREALRTLEAEGMIEINPHKGVRVTPVTAQEMVEWNLEFKGLMHACLPLAVPLMTPETIQKLRVLAERLDQEGLSSAEHLTFWRTIFAPIGMERLSGLLENLIWRLGRYFLAGGKVVFTRFKDVRPNRLDFLDACEAGDAAQAYQALITFMSVRMNVFVEMALERDREMAVPTPRKSRRA